MSAPGIPSEPPPAYSEATGSSSTATASGGGLRVPKNVGHRVKDRNGISAQSRRSMEDEARELPEGWTRQYDDKEHHQFFVDTRSDPPRSIWAHPYDDETFLKSLPSEERERIETLHRVPSDADMLAESSVDEDYEDHTGNLPPRSADQPKGVHKLGRKMKDKLTSSTHEEREVKRRKRAEEERRAYEAHQKIRQAMSKALQTGQPQSIGRDKDGKEVFIEPPADGYGGGYGGGYGSGYGRPYPGAYGYGSYGGVTSYSTPNARYIRPQAPYSRPYGYGYGGGLGMPLAAGLGGGLLFGGLLGVGLF